MRLTAPAGCRKRRVRDCARCSGNLLPPSPPAEQATARQDQTGKSSTGDRSWHGSRSDLEREAVVRPASPCPDIGSGRHAEAREGEVVPDRGGGQGSARDVARWQNKCAERTTDGESFIDANPVSGAAAGIEQGAAAPETCWSRKPGVSVVGKAHRRPGNYNASVRCHERSRGSASRFGANQAGQVKRSASARCDDVAALLCQRHDIIGLRRGREAVAHQHRHPERRRARYPSRERHVLPPSEVSSHSDTPTYASRRLNQPEQARRLAAQRRILTECRERCLQSSLRLA